MESWRGKTARFQDRLFVPFDPISIRISLLGNHLSFKVPLQLTDNMNFDDETRVHILLSARYF